MQFDDVVSDLRSLAKRLGEPDYMPSSKHVRKHLPYSEGIVRRLLAPETGSWKEAAESADLRQRGQGGIRRVTPKRLVREYRKVAEITGEDHVTQKMFAEYSAFSYQSVYNVFKSWQDLVELADGYSELPDVGWHRERAKNGKPKTWEVVMREVAAESLKTHGQTLDSFLTYCKDVRGLSGRTVSSYTYSLKGLVRFLGGHYGSASWSMTDVDAETVDDWIAALRSEDLAPATIQTKATAARMFFGFLCKRGVVEENPTRFLDYIKGEKRQQPWITEDQIDEVFELLDEQAESGGFVEIRANALVNLHYCAGTRVSELARMNLDDLDFENRTVLLRGKGKKERLGHISRRAMERLHVYLGERDKILGLDMIHNIPKNTSIKLREAAKYWPGSPESLRQYARAMPGTVLKGRDLRVRTHALEAWVRKRIGTNALWISKTHKRRLSRQMLSNYIKPFAVYGTGDSAASTHAFRRSFASHLISHGTDIGTVRDLMGHANLATTNDYIKTTETGLKRAHASVFDR